jgi:hypothetical protein
LWRGFVDVSGLAGHKVNQLRIVTAQALVTTHKGDAIATFYQIALLGKGKSILSCLQMEAYGSDINDRFCSLPGGKQRILVYGYQLPLDFKNGLPYLCCWKPTEAELSSLPHIIMTSDVDWDLVAPSAFPFRMMTSEIGSEPEFQTEFRTEIPKMTGKVQNDFRNPVSFFDRNRNRKTEVFRKIRRFIPVF